MCTSIVTNFNKTIIGWNLDLLDMQWKVVVDDDKVYIAVLDKTEGWLPLFGANDRGDFVAMPTCWPYDNRSDPSTNGQMNIINLDIDLLLKNKSFDQIRRIVETQNICSVPGVTFQAQLSSPNGDVLQVIPGQGYKFIDKPQFAVLTNFSPFKMDSETHPWMGMDRYLLANRMLSSGDKNFDVKNMFDILKSVSQTVCPTVVSMVYDVTQKIVYWCENKDWENVLQAKFQSAK